MSTTVHPTLMAALIELAEVINRHGPKIYDEYGMSLGITVDLDGEKQATLYEEGWDFV